MPKVVVIGSPSRWPQGWSLAPFELELIDHPDALPSASAIDGVVLVPASPDEAVAHAKAVDDFRGTSVIAKLFASEPSFPRLNALLIETECDGYLDLGWPAPVALAALSMALRHVELGRNIVDIQRTILAQSRTETAALRELAGHDELTHLYNRRHFSAAVAREHDRSRRREHPYALVFIDLDNLKQLNSRWGHAGGSKALRELAGLLMASVRTSDMAARMGGDEFVVFLDDCDAGGALEFANRFCQNVHDHAFDVDGTPVPISVSAGVAAYPRHGKEYAELLQCADVALYEAKALGKGRAVAFDNARRPPSALPHVAPRDLP